MAKQNSRESRRQRLEQARQAEQRRKRRIRVAAPAAGPLGPEAVPVPSAPALASTATAATGAPVDGISCNAGEQTLFHIHAHLTIFVNGAARQIPTSIGIPGGVAQQTQGRTSSVLRTGTSPSWSTGRCSRGTRGMFR